MMSCLADWLRWWLRITAHTILQMCVFACWGAVLDVHFGTRLSRGANRTGVDFEPSGNQAIHLIHPKKVLLVGKFVWWQCSQLLMFEIFGSALITLLLVDECWWYHFHWCPPSKAINTQTLGPRVQCPKESVVPVVGWCYFVSLMFAYCIIYNMRILKQESWNIWLLTWFINLEDNPRISYVRFFRTSFEMLKLAEVRGGGEDTRLQLLEEGELSLGRTEVGSRCLLRVEACRIIQSDSLCLSEPLENTDTFFNFVYVDNAPACGTWPFLWNLGPGEVLMISKYDDEWYSDTWIRYAPPRKGFQLFDSFHKRAPLFLHVLLNLFCFYVCLLPTQIGFQGQKVRIRWS